MIDLIVGLVAGFVLGVLFARFAVTSWGIELSDDELFNGHPPGVKQPFWRTGKWVCRG